MKSLTSFVMLILFFCSGSSYSQNPFITHIYAADPSAHVWPNDANTLWLYTSHDVPDTNHHATMFDYHVFSTVDLVNWIDHGRVLSVDDVDWAVSYAWAPDAAYRHGKYYLIFCMREIKTGIFRTGIAISDVPQGPFKNIGFIRGVEGGQDPAVFVDDDNTPYLYWGAGGHIFAAELNDDLKSIIPDTKIELTKQLVDCYEGPWLHKYQGKYYLSYPALQKGKFPEDMRYAIADKPLGPCVYQGSYIPLFNSKSGTNHGSIVAYQNQWIAFHHTGRLSHNGGYDRNLMGDYLYYKPDGTIQPITPDASGLSKGKAANCIILLEAENGIPAGGKLAGTRVETSYQGFSVKVYVNGFDVPQVYVEVLAQVANDMNATLKIRLAAENDFAADILVGPKMRDGWDGTKIKKTQGWEEVDLGVVPLKAGDNKIRVTARNKVNLKIDYFKVEPLPNEGLNVK